MEAEFRGLPPVKRFSLMQRRWEEDNKENCPPAKKHEDSMNSACLPVKKRKECRDLSPFLPISTANNFPLPAKKRVLAIHPFDLNLEYEPFFDSSHKQVSSKGSEMSTEFVNHGSGLEKETDGFMSAVAQITDGDTGLSPELINHEFGIEEENDGIMTAVAETADGDTELSPEPINHESGIEDENDGILCAVCESTDGDPTDPIVLCDGCDLMVHAICYGRPLTAGVPEGDWFCSQCLAAKSPESLSPKAEFSCCLCPAPGGALKPTTDGKWAHLVCAIYVPEVFFSDPEGRESIDCSKVPARRWGRNCYVCQSGQGCAVDCSEPNCPLAFHVTCGLKEELCIEYRQKRNRGAVVAAFCAAHTDLWKKQMQTGKFKIVARGDQK